MYSCLGVYTKVCFAYMQGSINLTAMKILEKYIELTNKDWFKNLTLNSNFKLNGLKINDSENQIDKRYEPNTFNNTKEDTRKIYRCPNFKNHYKVKNGKIIGFGLVMNELTLNDFTAKFGQPNSEDTLIGNVYGMDSYDIEGFDLIYNNFRLVINPSKEKLESIQFGEKLLYWDE